MVERRTSGQSRWPGGQAWAARWPQTGSGNYWWCVWGGGSIGAKIRSNKIVFFGFPWFFKVFSGFYGVSIIPEWLINVPGHIAILLGWFLELPTCSLFTDPYPPYLSPTYFKNTRKKYGNLLEKYSFSISQLSGNQKISKLWTPPDPIFRFFYFGNFRPKTIFISKRF